MIPRSEACDYSELEIYFTCSVLKIDGDIYVFIRTIDGDNFFIGLLLAIYVFTRKYIYLFHGKVVLQTD